jgi:hypothetical protein
MSCLYLMYKRRILKCLNFFCRKEDWHRESLGKIVNIRHPKGV